ncbi:hypothetical protein A176_000539 [Myxococcus hansupus]|uniref:Uncharacterized protein n=1 Tax=Pseudomyxococcus hansupus TaxID=1297742 RepID=A0A0H4X6Z1_9BACT|nr:hypothetical protein [Myxococcus hansupus]AKQ63627.1 hypothetical protein A176_000539 [Myxococcus hansupus]
MMPPSHLPPFVTEEASRTDVSEASPWPVAPPPARVTVDPLEPEVFASWGLGPEQFAAHVSPAARALHAAVTAADAPASSRPGVAPSPREPRAALEASAASTTESVPGLDDGAWEGAQSLLEGGRVPPRGRCPAE